MKIIKSSLILFAAGAAAVSMTACTSLNKGWRQEKVVTMPECSVAIDRSTAGSAYSSQFSSKGIASSMKVMTPLENQKVYQSIADESCARLKAKLGKLGYTVVAGPELEAKSEKYKEIQKKHFTKEMDVRDQFAFFPSSETGVPKGGMGFNVGMGYANISRSIQGVMIQPTFKIAFGNVRGNLTNTSAKYSPTVTVKRDGSRIPFFYSESNGAIELSKDINDDSVAWLNDIVKSELKNDFTMSVDEPKMKEAILAQLDKAEDELVGQIEKIKTEE